MEIFFHMLMIFLIRFCIEKQPRNKILMMIHTFSLPQRFFSLYKTENNLKPKNIEDYELKENEVKILRPRYHPVSGEFLGI